VSRLEYDDVERVHANFLQITHVIPLLQRADLDSTGTEARHVDARLGMQNSAVPLLWLLALLR
jgi:hypothetical protein